jgi:two-component system sensor histidine kinase AtoS
MERRLVDSERLSAMGEMAGEIGHELNNYLMAIGGRAELIPRALDRGQYAKARVSAASIVGHIAEMRTLTDGLLESARKESSPREIDLNALVNETIDFVRPQNRFDGIEIRAKLDEGVLPVFADPQQARQVLLNLLANAADAIAEAGADEGRVDIRTYRDGTAAAFRITDNGVGMDEATRMRIFEPRFTTKSGGNGFGLAVCHRVVTNHRGEIRARSRPGGGATFTVRLPLAPVSVSSDREARTRAFL